ncbi:Tyrosine-protein kinase MasK [bacterium HR11]|nr:Tyrosine-protein kinase MasK [bacterium HR11]
MSPKVLVAHYDPRVRQRLRGLLERWGLQVSEAADGLSAVEQARQARPDLILLYAPLPRLNAPEACQQIRQLPGFQTTPVVIFSDVYRGVQVRNVILRRFGATDLVEWPMAEEVLRQRVSEWLAGSASPTVAVARPAEEAGLDPELERELRTLLAQWEAPPEATQALTPAESLPTVPAAPPEVLREVLPEVEEVITDLAAEETLLLEEAPEVPGTTPPSEAVDERQIVQEVQRILQETVGGGEGPSPAAPTVLVEKPAPGPVGEVEGTPFGPYVLLKRVATGGMAELFVAKKRGVEGFEKTLAIKRILPHLSDNKEFITMFIDEAKVAARLTHPNIVQIFDMGRIDGDYYIAMEYVPGKDLRAVLRRAQEAQRPVPVEIAVIVAIHLCAALDYAHRARDDQGRPLHIVHRDVSPPNVLISYDGDIKLTDFGVAKAAVKMHITLSGALKGKVLYMAPEQANLQPVDARSDIYSLGVVLYEMLAGRNPFYDRGDTELTILEKVRQGRVPPIRTFRPDVPETLAQILEKALQPDPARRYETARELQRDLEDFLVQRGVPNSTLYVARFIRELFPEEAGPVDEIREKLRHLPRIELRTPPAAVEAPSEAAPTVLVETPVPPSLPVSAEAAPPTGVGARSFEEIAYPMVTPKRRRPTALFVFLLVGLFVVIAGAITGIVLRQTSVRSRPATPVVPVSPPPAPSEPTRPETPPALEPAPTVSSEAPAPSTTPVPETPAPTVPAEAEAPAPSPPRPPAKAPAPPTSPMKAPEVSASTPPAQAPPRETARPSEKTPTKPAPPPGPTKVPEVPPTSHPSPPPEAPSPETAVETKAPAPPTPPAEAPRVRPGDLVETPDEPPALLKRAPADFPALARSQRLSDTVIIRVLVDERGSVVDAQVLRYKYAILRDAALEAVRKYTFRPARHQGVPVKSWYTVSVIFQP